MKKKVGNKGNKGDVVSTSLPDDLIRRVIFLLDMKSMVQTCLLLSKDWDKNTWKTARSLVFDEKGIGREVFVNTVLEKVPTFEKLELHMEDFILGAGTIGDFYAWIDRSLMLNVKEMSIYIKDAVGDLIKVTFPEILFTSESLEKLVIKLNYRYLTSVQQPKSPRLDKLQYLWLGSFATQDLNELISNCPVLETLIFEDITMESNNELRVQSDSLRQFEILNDATYLYAQYTLATRIRITTPNLLSFVCKDFMLQEYDMQDLSSLQSAEVGIIKEIQEDAVVSNDDELTVEVKERTYPGRMLTFLTALNNVKNLTITSPTFLEVLSKAILDGHIVHFPNLQRLDLKLCLSRHCWPAIHFLLDTSPQIEFIALALQDEREYLEEDGAELGLIDPQLSHLKRIIIREAKGSDKIPFRSSREISVPDFPGGGGRTKKNSAENDDFDSLFGAGRIILKKPKRDKSGDLPSSFATGRLLLSLKSLNQVVDNSSSKRAKKNSSYSVGSLVEAEIWDFSSQLNSLAGSETDIGVLLVIGRLVSGVCDSHIHLWESSSTATWNVDTTPFDGHDFSVEDLQWSPSERDVFASCSVDGTIAIWDIRRKKPAATIKANKADVNVISWNRVASCMLASGSDDGTFTVRDQTAQGNEFNCFVAYNH
ncbi:hypothetical protein MKW98_009115 [Papaver atlanticum]|uniref:F-box/LRR-repeat protein 15/At3g58940/PEG3-like LRR domain-containing protein n=1 Tax=Papaver atlanticum TaxID=357466 RepID=A0AAD4XSY5_9MAGN|nr:hypothetical protein MKW98_009115 [Papaver atlanticum]